MRIIIITCLTIFLSCTNSRTERQSKSLDTTLLAPELIDSVKTKSTERNENQAFTVVDSLKLRADSSELHFHFNFKNSDQKSIDFFSGYEVYDEDKYGFQNPAYLKTFIDSILVFEESFEAYEKHWMDYVGAHIFSDTLDFYKLNYGLEATDYFVAERLIAISKSNIQLVDEFNFQATDYASRFIEYLYPPDSGSLPNSIIVIEKVNYRSGEEPNLADTIYYDYVNGEFKKRGS